MNNGDTIPTTGELVVTSCWCGVQLAVPSNLKRWADKDSANGLYCPLGHRFVYKTSDRDRLRAAEARERHLEDQLVAAAVEAERVRARLIRDRHRFARGVCPCCNRSFPALARHMATQHPDYDPVALTAAPIEYRCSCGRSFTTPHGLAVHQGRSRQDGWAEPSTPKWRAHLTLATS